MPVQLIDISYHDLNDRRPCRTLPVQPASSSYSWSPKIWVATPSGIACNVLGVSFCFTDLVLKKLISKKKDLQFFIGAETSKKVTQNKKIFNFCFETNPAKIKKQKCYTYDQDREYLQNIIFKEIVNLATNWQSSIRA